MKKVILTKFETTKDGHRWVCQLRECKHSSEFMTIAIYHQHLDHYLPMRTIKDEGNYLVWEE